MKLQISLMSDNEDNIVCECHRIQEITQDYKTAVKKYEGIAKRIEEDTDKIIVKLNVGGDKMQTYLDTLTEYPDSYFGIMFSGRYRDVGKIKAGEELFLDRDPELFRIILSFLRTGCYPSSITPEIINEFDYYGLPLSNRMISYRTVKPSIEIRDARVLRFTLPPGQFVFIVNPGLFPSRCRSAYYVPKSGAIGFLMEKLYPSIRGGTSFDEHPFDSPIVFDIRVSTISKDPYIIRSSSFVSTTEYFRGLNIAIDTLHVNVFLLKECRSRSMRAWLLTTFTENLYYGNLTKDQIDKMKEIAHKPISP
jgi:hypothetical protein